MDWKREATDKLQQLERMRHSLRRIPVELEGLREEMKSLRSVDTAKAAVRGGGWSDDRLINALAQIKELEGVRRRTQLWIRSVESALDTLVAEDRLLLEELYVKKDGSVEGVCEALYIQPSSVYRRREKALREFTLAMYGAVES